MLKSLLTVTAWIGILILSFTLRWQQIEKRPLHADEATGARILAQRLAGDHYQFNPQHFHGPLLSLTSSPIAQLRGEETWSSLTVTTLRLGPVVAGMLLILTPLLWIRSIGTGAALMAGTLLATSPLLIYYNRMYIHESLLTLLTMLSCAAVFRLSLKPSKRMGIIAGFSLGLMFATKETFAISVLAWLPAAGACIWRQHRTVSPQAITIKLSAYLMPALLLAVTTASTAAYFYSDGFRSPQGMIDALRTYFVYETTAGHEKNFSYYFQLLLWPKHQLGMWWSEALIFLLAVAAVLLATYKRISNPAMRFLVIATLGHFIIYSCISYKTPWLVLAPWAHACLLAGCVIKTLPHLRIRPRILLGLLFLGGLSYQTQQSIQASGRLANDSRNPYAYVPTSQDAPKIEHWLQQLNNLKEVPPLTPIAVVGQEYWPLPWYLRHFDTIGYWPAPIEDFTHFTIVFAMPAHVLACDQLLETTHVKLPRSLRSNVPITLYLRKDIWQQWMNTTEE